MNSILKYPGAKWNLADWIISHFPPHHSYLEPFFGSGAVLFSKQRSNIETVNDLDGDVVNLFQCIRQNPEKLQKIIYYTPYSRQEYEKSYLPARSEDPLDRAVRFLVRCNQGYGFRTNGSRVGWKNDVQGRERAYAAKYWTELPTVIDRAAERLRGVQIECRPAAEVIAKFNSENVLIYCDPPYVLSSRSSGKRQYKHEMTDEDHLELLTVLKKHRGPVLVSGYASKLYDRELQGWCKETAFTTDQLSRTRQEVLWMNFEPVGQMSIVTDMGHQFRADQP